MSERIVRRQRRTDVVEEKFSSFDETLAFVSEEKRWIVRLPISGLWKGGARFHENGRFGDKRTFFKLNNHGPMTTAGAPLGEVKSGDDGRMKGLGRLTDATVGDQLIFKHLIMDFDISKMGEQRAACQNMIEHLRPSVMHHSKTPVCGQGPLNWG
jgi:hypothetical protein